MQFPGLLRRVYVSSIMSNECTNSTYQNLRFWLSVFYFLCWKFIFIVRLWVHGKVHRGNRSISLRIHFFHFFLESHRRTAWVLWRIFWQSHPIFVRFLHTLSNLWILLLRPLAVCLVSSGHVSRHSGFFLGGCLMYLHVLLAIKSSIGGILSNQCLTSSFVMWHSCTSSILIPKILLIDEWWNDWSFFRIFLVILQDSAPHKNLFTGPLA